MYFSLKNCCWGWLGWIEVVRKSKRAWFEFASAWSFSFVRLRMIIWWSCWGFLLFPQCNQRKSLRYIFPFKSKLPSLSSHHSFGTVACDVFSCILYIFFVYKKASFFSSTSSLSFQWMQASMHTSFIQNLLARVVRRQTGAGEKTGGWWADEACLCACRTGTAKCSWQNYFYIVNIKSF